jgi:hypothetical protein
MVASSVNNARTLLWMPERVTRPTESPRPMVTRQSAKARAGGLDTVCPSGSTNTRVARRHLSHATLNQALTLSPRRAGSMELRGRGMASIQQGAGSPPIAGAMLRCPVKPTSKCIIIRCRKHLESESPDSTETYIDTKTRQPCPARKYWRRFGNTMTPHCRRAHHSQCQKTFGTNPAGSPGLWTVSWFGMAQSSFAQSKYTIK